MNFLCFAVYVELCTYNRLFCFASGPKEDGETEGGDQPGGSGGEGTSRTRPQHHQDHFRDFPGVEEEEAQREGGETEEGLGEEEERLPLGERLRGMHVVEHRL